MSELYPPESQRMDLVGHLEELRRRILTCFVFFVAAVFVLFSQGQKILTYLEKPASGLIKEFIFLTPTEAFATYVMAVLLAGFIVCFPVLLYELWAFLAPALAATSRRVIFIWLFFAVACFFGGVAFAYGILLPTALTFLLNFGEGIARPAISVSKYISFAIVVILAGGCVFEIPVVVGILTEAGILNPRGLRASRRYAIFIIFVIAALVTPTQDVVNLMLFAAPMVVLYEIGILVASIVEKRKNKSCSIKFSR